MVQRTFVQALETFQNMETDWETETMPTNARRSPHWDVGQATRDRSTLPCGMPGVGLLWHAAYGWIASTSVDPTPIWQSRPSYPIGPYKDRIPTSHWWERCGATTRIPHLLAKTLWDVRYKQQRLNELVWNDSSKAFRDKFRSLVAFFQLPATLKPYSLRRGGATSDFKSHGSMEKTLLRGRWGSTGAARNYVQEGLSALTKLSLTHRSATLLKHYATFLQWPYASWQGDVERPGGDREKFLKSNMRKWVQQAHLNSNKFLTRWSQSQSCSNGLVCQMAALNKAKS